MLGTDFPYSAFLPKHCKIAQVDIMPEHLGRRTPIDLGLAGDLTATLDKLLPTLKNKENSALKALQQKTR